MHHPDRICDLLQSSGLGVGYGGMAQRNVWVFNTKKQSWGRLDNCMESPTVLELQWLLSRLRDAAPFSTPELLLLQRTSHALAAPQPLSSERANLASQIWLLLSELGPLYWQHLDFILAHSDHPPTRSLALASLAARVRRDWPLLPEEQQRAVKEYVVGLVESAVEAGEEARAELLRANEVLVALLKHEWNGLFKDFVSSFLTLEDCSPNKQINNFRLLQAVIAEGFGSWDQTLTTAQRDGFRSSIDHDMRDILKIVVRTLRDERTANVGVVESCLEMLGEGLQYIPAYELFNCNLVELLLRLLGSRHCQPQLIRCFEEIFAFRERTELPASHTGIARKLLQVLEVFLKRSQEADCPFDKETVSTLDDPSSQPSSQLVLSFLTRFLQRYVPSMDKTPEANDLEIEYDPKTKLRFSEELYDSLGKLFWRFWRFLGQVIEGTVNNLAYEEREEELQVLESVKLMLQMLGKLKIGSDEDMEAVLESLIVRMTPCPNEFGKFYVLTELMLEETHVRSYCRHFSQEYLAHFSRIFQLVLSTPKTLQIYLKVMDKLYADLHLKERPALPRRSKENVEPGRGKYSGWLCGRVELVNRVSWNIVLSVNANCDALAGFGLQRWVSGYLKLIQEVEPVELKKCLSLNMKYLALGYSPHFNSAQYHALLFAPLATTLSDHIVEFLLALLAAVFTHPLFAFLLIDQDQLHTLVAKVRHIDASGTFDDLFIRIYPALYALFVKMFEAPNQDAAAVTTLVKELRAPLIEEELHSLEEFARSEDEMDVPALKRSIFYFEKLHAVSRYLRGAFGGGEKTNRGFPWLVKHHLQWVVKCLGTYEYKHYQFSEQLKLQTRDTYESNEMNTFRESYVALATDYILLAIVRTEQESVDDKLNPERRSKLMQERSHVIEQCYSSFLKDFCSHTDFRSVEFITFTLQYYRWHLLTRQPNSQDAINCSVAQMAEQLSSEPFHQVESLRARKYVYWQEVVTQLLFVLSRENAESLVRVFQEIDGMGRNVSYSQFESIIAIMQATFTKLASHSDFSCQSEPPIWNYLLTIFTFTFESFFSSVFRDEALFLQLAHVFHLQTLDALRWRQELFKNGQRGRSNTEVLFLHLHGHVLKHMEMDSEQEEVHNGLLSDLLRESRREQFVDRLRDYVVFINRTVNAIKLRRNEPLP